ncbi:hypothetical protein ACROYT_G036873 [Oculina patagonica]
MLLKPLGGKGNLLEFFTWRKDVTENIHVNGYRAKLVNGHHSLPNWYKSASFTVFLNKEYLERSEVATEKEKTPIKAGTDSKPATMSSSEERRLGEHKRVHWALDLEEIVYFTRYRFEFEETEGKISHSMLKKLKMKIRAMKNKRLAALLDSCDRDCLLWLQKTFERIIKKNLGRFGTFYIEDVKDLNKYWDELFNLYGEYKPNYQELT